MEPVAASPVSDGPQADPRDGPMLQSCGEGDAHLHRLAAAVAERLARGQPALDSLELADRLRALGGTHVRVRAWAASAVQINRAEATSRMVRWLGVAEPGRTRRCGVSSMVDSVHGEIVAVVAAEAPATLLVPVERHVRVGRWVTLEAVLLEPAEQPQLLVLGPRGGPRRMAGGYDPQSKRLLGRFAADEPGRWLVQVLATTEEGPRPVLELDVLAGGDRGEVGPSVAPGEDAGAQEADDAARVVAMINAARRSEGLMELERDPELDELALQHSRAMQAAGTMAHDLGQSTAQRMADAGLDPSRSGENVAHASRLELAHRSLWASPSHRGNMLDKRFARVGVGVVRDPDAYWITQVYAQ